MSSADQNAFMLNQWNNVAYYTTGAGSTSANAAQMAKSYRGYIYIEEMLAGVPVGTPPGDAIFRFPRAAMPTSI